MKQITCLLILMLILAIFTGCAKQGAIIHETNLDCDCESPLFVQSPIVEDDTSKASWSEMIAENSTQNSLVDLYSMCDSVSNVSLNRLTTYDYSLFAHKNGLWGVVKGVSDPEREALSSLQEYNEMFPIEHIKFINQELICVVYSLEKEDGLTSLVCVLFNRVVYQNNTSSDAIAEENFEKWYPMCEFYYVSQVQPFEDYKHLCVGDSAEEVLKMDPFITGNMNKESKLYKLLSDGLLTIQFDKNEDGTLKSITAMDFYPYHCDYVPENKNMDRVSIIHCPDLLAGFEE